MGDFPVGPRLSAGLASLGAVALLLVRFPMGLVSTGHPLAAAAMAASAVPLIVLLGWMALSPGTLQGPLRRVSKVDLRDARHGAALLVLAIALYFVIGFSSLVQGAYSFEEHRAGSADLAAPMDEGLLLQNLLLSAAILVLPVLLFVSLVHGIGPLDTMRALGFRLAGAPAALAIGVASAVVAILVIALTSFALQQGGVSLPENDRALAIAKSVTLFGALAISVFAGLGEEVFFRGFLQSRIGLLGQAALFSLAHLSYVNLTETVVTFGLALAFGLLYRRTRNLWAPIAAHFAFNLIMLTVGMYAP